MTYDAEKLAYWSEHHRGWQASGLSQRDYCAQTELSYYSFEYWRRRAREIEITDAVADDATAAPRKLTLVPTSLGTSTATSDFPQSGLSRNIELQSPGGWRITLPPTLGQDAIIQLLTQLP